MRIAACYIRVSTDDQLEYSPDSQLAAIRRYAKANDLILPDEFIFIEQDGISGRKADKRPEFQRMIGTAKTKPKPFDVVLLWKFSRFARNREDSIVYKSMLRKQLGIEVISISENVGDDKMSVIFEAMIEAMDEYYSINLAEEVKRGMTEKAKRGEALSIAPLGYKMVNKQLVIDPDKAEIVRTVFEKYLAGSTIRGIAEWLNDIGIKTKRGNMIENRTIEYWLRNPVYNGYIRWTPTGRTRRNYDNPDSIIAKGTHEAIIDDDLWNKVQDKMKEQKAKYSFYRRPATKNSYSLSGIIKCSACGCAIVKSTNEYMQCCGYAHGTCKTSQSNKIDKLLILLISAIADDIKNDTYRLDTTEPVKQQRSDRDIIAAQVERERQKLVRAKEAYLNGIDTADEYKRNKTALQEEIDRLQAELDKLPDDEQPAEGIAPKSKRDEYRNNCKRVLTILQDPNIPEPEKNAELKSLIKKAIYDKNNQAITIFYH